MKALLLFAMLPLFFIPMAFAEERTIDVPFTVAEQNCETYYDPNRDGIEIMRCWFVNQIMDDDYQPSVLIPTTATVVEFEVVAPEPIPEPKVELNQDQEQLLKVANALEYLNNIRNPTASESWWIENLGDNLRFCSYGIIGATKSFQDPVKFVISPDWISYSEDGIPTYDFPEIPVTQSVKFRSGDGGAKLFMANQACIGQGNYYDGDISPQHYENFLTDALPEGQVCTYESIKAHQYDCQPQHQNMAAQQGNTKQSLSPRGDELSEAEKAEAYYCASPTFSTADKKQRGCIIHYDSDGFTGTSSNSINMIGNTPLIKTEWQYRTCGLIDWTNIANDRYKDFLDEIAYLPCDAEYRITGIMLFDPIKERDAVFIENGMSEIRNILAEQNNLGSQK